MEEFFGERIEVERHPNSPKPLRFILRGQIYEVSKIIHERVDTGFGELPPTSRKWYTRRHRRYYIVQDSQEEFFEIYLDYADKQKQTWWLVKRWKHNEI